MAKIEYGYVSIDDFERVIAHIPSRDEMYAVAFSLIRYRGLRPASVIQLKTWDILENGKLHVHNTKKDRHSSMTIPPLAWQRLAHYVENNRQRFMNGYLFTGATSRYDHITTNQLCKKFRYYFQLAGLSCDFTIDTNKKLWNAGRKLHHTRLYDLRASFGTDIQRTKNDLYTTSVMLDHADTRTAHIYLRKAALLDQGAILEQVFNRPRAKHIR